MIRKGLPKQLLEIIRCPIDKAELKYSKLKNKLTCTKCKHVYKIVSGIPVLTPPKNK